MLQGFKHTQMLLILIFFLVVIFQNMVPFTKSLAVEDKLPDLNMTVPESSGARFFRVSV